MNKLRLVKRFLPPALTILYDIASLFWCYVILNQLVFNFSFIYANVDGIEVVGPTFTVVMENILQGNPNVKAVFAQNDEMALGALEAITAARKDVIVIGFDATDDAVAKVQAGEMAATVAQQPALIGEKAIEAAVKILAGESVDENIPVDLELITK